MKKLIGVLSFLFLATSSFANDIVCELHPMPLLRGPMTYNPINVTCTTEDGAIFSGFLDRRQGVKTAIYEAESEGTVLKFELDYPKKTVQELVFFRSLDDEILREIKRNNPSISDGMTNLHLSKIIVDENYLQVYVQISNQDFERYFGQLYPDEVISDDGMGRAPIFQYGKRIYSETEDCKRTSDSWAIEISSLGQSIAMYEVSCLRLNETGDMLTYRHRSALCPLNNDGSAKSIEECRNFPWPTYENKNLALYGYQNINRPSEINRVKNINEDHPIYCYDYQGLNSVIGDLKGSTQRVFRAVLLCDQLLPDGRVQFGKSFSHDCLSDENGQLPPPETCYADNSITPRDFPF